MIFASVALFAVSAVLGLILLTRWLTHKTAPRGVIYSHGIIAAAGIVSLGIYALQNPNHFPKASLILFIVSALGGFYMFFRDLAKKTSPLVIAFIHALLAVCGFVALLLFAVPL
jgi:hypothetical protein